MPTVDAKGLVKQYIELFKSDLSQQQIERFYNTKLNDVKYDILGIQQEQDRRGALMGFQRIHYFVNGFAQFDNACKRVELGGDELSAFIWGPFKSIIQTAKEHSDVFDAVLESYLALGRVMPKLDSFTHVLREIAASKQCLAYMYHDLVHLQKKLLHFLVGREWKNTFLPNWRDYQDSFKETIVAAFKDHAKILEKLLTAYQGQETQAMLQRMTQQMNDIHGESSAHHQQMQDYMEQTLLNSNEHSTQLREFQAMIEQELSKYAASRDRLFSKVEGLETAAKENQYLVVTKWFSDPNSQQSGHYKNFRDIRLDCPNTAQWILQHRQVRNWVMAETPTHSMLWINGMAGAGKTIIASSIIDHCISTRRDYKTSYYYFREDDQVQNPTLAVYKGLLTQLIDHNRELLPYCYEKKLRNEDTLREDTARSLIDIFCDSNMKQFIIIDGLNECSSLQDRKGIMQFLAEIVKKCDGYEPGKLRVLIISRDLIDIRKAMTASANILDMDPEDIEGDIKKYVARNMKRLEKKFKLTGEELREVERLTCKRSAGMFLFPVLIMNHLENQPSVEDLRVELRENTFPTDIRKAYEKIIDRLQNDLGQNGWNHSKTIFAWLICAMRPLKWHEVQCILSMDIQDGGRFRFDFKGRRMVKDVREMCGSLVNVRKERRIEFIHPTAKEHLLNNEKLNLGTMQADLLVICLNYLSSRCFNPNISDKDRQSDAKLGLYVFHEYAVSKWEYHLEAVLSADASSKLLQDPAYIAKLHTALRRFTTTYKDDLMLDQASDHGSGQQQMEPTASTAEADCQAFENTVLYQDIVMLWTHVREHQMQKDPKLRYEVSIKTLRESLKKIREKLQQLDGHTAHQDITMRELYGRQPFKCERVRCDYFYEGFETPDELSKHLERHDRPFLCPQERCSMVPFGFSTRKDRDKHVRRYHPDISDQASGFSDPAKAVPSGPARHTCNVCKRPFTRNLNKIAHERSHFGERPYLCQSGCDKAFTRANDRNRHQNTVHKKRRR